MQAIADDSGCKGQGPVAIIAGLMDRAENFANFSDQWAECLKAAPQRASRTKKNHDFHWLAEHLTNLKPSHRCVNMDANWFENLRSHIAEARLNPLPLAAMIEMARLEGAPIRDDLGRVHPLWESRQKNVAQT